MNRIKLGIIVLLVVSMGACKITRTVTGSSESRIHPDEFKANEESGWEGLKILKLKGADLSFEWNGEAFRLHANLGIIMDSIIVASVIPAAGIEVMRIYCTEDSLLLINRRDKTFDKISLDDASRLLGFYFDLKDIQGLLTGQPFIYSGIKAGEYKKKKLVTGNGLNAEEYTSVRGGKSGTSQRMYFDDDNGSIRRIVLMDKDQGSDLSVDYEKISIVEDIKVPGVMKMVMRDSGNRIVLEIRDARITVNQDIRLGKMVPDGYKRSHIELRERIPRSSAAGSIN